MEGGGTRGILRRTYDWVLHWAHTPYGTWALFILAFCESSFFPIPPDVLLIALAISIPTNSFRYASVCSTGSVLGGAFGYIIGLFFMEAIGFYIIDLYGFTDRYEYLHQLYRRYDAWVVGIAGFTPIPYKVFTITAGAFRIDFGVFIIASLISRSARFFLLAFFVYHYGEGIKGFIDRYFNLLTVVFTVFLILGFLVIKWLL
ncbi:MAG: DedA family protein [Deltaproteobacteria bacterium]|nr:DedA family protein [Deltaproteobacteria bacterium]